MSAPACRASIHKSVRAWGGLLAAAALLGFTTAGGADPLTVRPGDPSIHGDIIKPYKNRWKLIGRGPDGSTIEMGTWIDVAKIDRIDGREVILRQQLWVHDHGSEGYVNVVDHKTLAPILSQYTNAAGLYRRIEFSPDGRKVRYQSSPVPEQGPAAGSTPYRISAPMVGGEIKLPSPLFDFNTGMFGLLLAGFPLKEGYSARFPVFRSYDPKPDPAWVDFEVQGREKVPAGPGKTLDTWLVVVHSPDTGEVMTINLSSDPPYIIRLRQPWDGRDWTFEMM
jgi:hypothetical protein